MERYAILHGEDGQNGYGKLASDAGILEFITGCGADNAPRVVSVVSELLRGFYPLEGYGDQPQRNKPLTVRYAPMYLRKRDDMPNTLKPFYAMAVCGLDTESGKRADAYDFVVVTDQNTLLTDPDYTYLDQLFGTYPVNSNDLIRMRKKGKMDVNINPCKVSPVIYREDAEAVYAAVEAIFGSRTVVIRLEQGAEFNNRSKEVLSQIYSLLPSRLAVETGFASYQDPIKIRRITGETGIRVFVVPAEASLEYIMDDTLVLDLSDSAPIPAGNSLLVKCLRRWGRLSWEQRSAAMEKLFANVGAGVRDTQVFAKITSDFFGDPFFQYKPEGLGISTLEALKAECDQFPVLKYEIDWVNRKLTEMLPLMLAPGVKLPQLKAEAAANARMATAADERKKQTALYRFAQRLDPADASLFAIVQTENAIAGNVNSKVQAAVQERESQLKLEAEAALAAALAAQKAEFEKQLKEKDEACAKKVQEANARKDQAVKEANAQKDKALKEANAQKDKAVKEANDRKNQALQDAKNQKEQALKEAKARNDKALADQKEAQKQEIQKLTAAHNAEMDQLKREMAAEIQKVKDSVPSHVTVAPTADGKQVEELKKRIAELTAANNTQIAKLKETHAKELQALKEAHAKELAQKPKATQTVVVNQNASAQEISDKTKQVLAAQLLRNLGQMEQMKARYQAEISALKNT